MRRNALFTIAIPTFNRARTFLPRALDCALAQNGDNLEILVSDNASTDETRAVVSGAGSRVRYIRNETNIGASANCARLIEEARGEYISFLQDDDLIHHNFVDRARAGLEIADDIMVYAAFQPFTRSASFLIGPTLFGPAIKTDWLTGKVTIVDGRIILPLGLFCLGPLPPALAFRRSALKGVFAYIDPRMVRFAERILVGLPAAAGRFVADPWIAAIHLNHGDQLHAKPSFGSLALNDRAQCALFHQLVARIIGSWRDDWCSEFADHLEYVSIEDRRQWLSKTLDWTEAPDEIRRIVKILEKSLPAEIVHEVMASRPSFLKNMARDLTPPILWRAASTLRRGPSD